MRQVENYRLTKEQRVLQKNLGQLRKQARIVQQRLILNMKEGMGLRTMLGQLTDQMKIQLNQAPEQPMNELFGQDIEAPPQTDTSGMAVG